MAEEEKYQYISMKNMFYLELHRCALVCEKKKKKKKKMYLRTYAHSEDSFAQAGENLHCALFYITKTRLFKYIENFISKNYTFSD